LFSWCLIWLLVGLSIIVGIMVVHKVFAGICCDYGSVMIVYEGLGRLGRVHPFKHGWSDIVATLDLIVSRDLGELSLCGQSWVLVTMVECGRPNLDASFQYGYFRAML
ncbi:hypothetical protein HAX54_005121, partial [Datura stramonium]|nr:hypothetical protein [Datura stramonium]